MGASAAPSRPVPPRARSLGRGGSLPLAMCARPILPLVCALASGTPAAAVGQLSSQALPQPEPLVGGGDLEEASYLRLGLLQTGAVLSGAVDAEGCEGPYVQAGLLQRGAQLTEAANASRRAGAPEDRAGAGRAAVPEAPWMVLGLRLLTVEGALHRSEGGTAVAILVATFVSLTVGCLACCCFALYREGPKRDRQGTSASRRPTGDLGGSGFAARAAAQPTSSPGIGGRSRSPQLPATPHLPAARSPEPATVGPGSAPPPRGTFGTAEPPAPRHPAAAGSAEALLPPVLCPTLVLPNMDTCFRISMEDMQAARPGTFSIRGASGRALLGVAVLSASGRRQLQIGPVGREDEPRAVVKANPAGAGQLTVYGPSGAFFGTLEPSGGRNRGRGASLVHDGEAKMLLVTELGPDLQFQAFGADGRLLADAGRSGQEWALRVRPKVDALLTVACMLAMVFCGPGSGGETSGAGQRSPGPAASRSPSAMTFSPRRGSDAGRL